MTLAMLRIVLTLCAVLAAPPGARADTAFQSFLAALWPEAQRLGVSRATFDAATRGLEPDRSLPDLVIPGRPEKAPEQPEFVQTPAQYLREPVLARLTAQGRQLANAHRATLAAIEKRFGVPPTILLAIWGRETDFGHYKLPHNAIRVLATQAYLGKRKDQFRQEFLLALKILEEGHVKLAAMRSSWAGAMGLTQFLPSEFYKYAVDFDGDGRFDIWNSVADALAAAAKQLLAKGWKRNAGWAYEVRVPNDLDCTIADPDLVMPVGEWIKRGFTPSSQAKIDPRDLGETASLFLPAGRYGPAFLTLKNFYVLKGYNFSDLYALFVGDLADRIGGARPGFATPWGKVVQLRTRDIELMQRILTKRGFYKDKIDGKAGQKTRLAFGAYQKTYGLKLDCWPTVAVLDHMRASTR